MSIQTITVGCVDQLLLLTVVYQYVFIYRNTLIVWSYMYTFSQFVNS